MKRFAALFDQCDQSSSVLVKVAAMREYFLSASAADSAWAVYFLAGAKPKQIVPTKLLRSSAVSLSGVSEWLFEESYQAVGDLAETIAHLLPAPTSESDEGFATWIEEKLIPLRARPAEQIAQALQTYWLALQPSERFVMNKLLTGGFRLGVSKQLVLRALAEAFKRDVMLLAQRMIGYTDMHRSPSAELFQSLIAPVDALPRGSSDGQSEIPLDLRPYPFFLAQSLQKPWPEMEANLGALDSWQVEWKWDGIRAQLVKRGGQVAVWSRGEELVSERFPELLALGLHLPDGCVIDGEILCWDGASQRPMPFADLQTRIGRKKLTAKVLTETPVILQAYDLLEWQGEDQRASSQSARRQLLESLVTQATNSGTSLCLKISQLVEASSWAALAQLREGARARGVEGLMLKLCSASYGTGRTKSSAQGEWWKWKVDPLTIDCVLIYAQAGHGRRASLYSDYTFALWQGDHLVPFAKAYSGLSDEEIKRVDAMIRKTTIEKFGPVRSVTPSLVFELGFDAVQRSPRHKSGLAVRFPRMLRWRQDKPVHEANRLEDLQAMLDGA